MIPTGTFRHGAFYSTRTAAFLAFARGGDVIVPGTDRHIGYFDERGLFDRAGNQIATRRDGELYENEPDAWARLFNLPHGWSASSTCIRADLSSDSEPTLGCPEDFSAILAHG